jgi:hypothetical protein
MFDQPRPSEEELEQAPTERQQEEEAMRGPGHEDPHRIQKPNEAIEESEGR